ncbi:hypothetical protein Fmac_021176 [Flemingia macrophylla]|uniref:Uncharacterized protein n=1 Tax=Flemingia macrophylla TaxID=520843 RepID=A0ABD1LW59_9FABA
MLIGVLVDYAQNFPCLKRMDLSNSKYLVETPDFSETPKLERLDISGCTNLLCVHPSIGLLKKLVFLSLRNCSNLVNINFDRGSNQSSLTVLDFSGCIKLVNTPDFTGAKNLKYLVFDGCSSLSSVHKSIGGLLKLEFFSLRNCKSLVGIPNNINAMKSLQHLDLRGCLKFENLPIGQYSYMWLICLIVLDLSFCNLLEVPVALRKLECLERLNLQGNKFRTIPSIRSLTRLTYLNLSHCHNLETLLDLPPTSDSLGGRYFKTMSGARDDRSGLYVFDCPKLTKWLYMDGVHRNIEHVWLARLIEKPCHFRCGFDIVVPRDFPLWLGHGYIGSSIIRIKNLNVNEDWLGIAFFAGFELNNASKGDIDQFHWCLFDTCEHPVDFDDVTNDMTNPEPKIRLPYNWLVTEKDEVENIEAKTKENNLSNVGL